MALSGLNPNPPSVSTQYSCNASCVCFGSQNLNTVVNAPLSKNTGESFTIGYAAAVNGSVTNSILHAQLRFVDLPAGTTVVSCQGYHQDSPVPARRPTWGTLKQIYR